MPLRAVAVVLLGGLLAACESKGGPRAPEPPAGPTSVFALRGEIDQVRAVDRELRGVDVGWIAEAERGEFRIAVVWVGVHGGEIVDNDLGGFAFRRDGKGWTLAPPPGDEEAEVPMGDGAASLRAALGGEYTLLRPDGLPTEELGPHLLASARRLRDALAAGRASEVVAAFEDGVRVFGPGLVIEDNTGIDLLIEGRVAAMDRLELRDVVLDGDTGGAVLWSTRGGDESSLPVRLVRAGPGWAIDGFAE